VSVLLTLLKLERGAYGQLCQRSIRALWTTYCVSNLSGPGEATVTLIRSGTCRQLTSPPRWLGIRPHIDVEERKGRREEQEHKRDKVWRLSERVLVSLDRGMFAVPVRDLDWHDVCEGINVPSKIPDSLSIWPLMPERSEDLMRLEGFVVVKETADGVRDMEG